MSRISLSLSPGTKLTVNLDRSRVSSIARENQMTPDQLIQMIEPVLNETLENTMQDMETWITNKVPKRTGQLRASLLSNMRSSKVARGVLRFIIGTHIGYAARVNRMSTSQVRHSSNREHSGKRAYAYYYGNYGRIYLNDPNAIGNFWERLLTYLKERILYHMNNAVRRQYGQTQLPWVIS